MTAGSAAIMIDACVWSLKLQTGFCWGVCVCVQMYMSKRIPLPSFDEIYVSFSEFELA